MAEDVLGAAEDGSEKVLISPITIPSGGTHAQTFCASPTLALR